MKNVFAFLFGALFSVGLMVSGMSNPEKVLDFLDLFGDWDASLRDCGGLYSLPESITYGATENSI